MQVDSGGNHHQNMRIDRSMSSHETLPKLTFNLTTDCPTDTHCSNANPMTNAPLIETAVLQAQHDLNLI